jgi:hypothetical protein
MGRLVRGSKVGWINRSSPLMCHLKKFYPSITALAFLSVFVVGCGSGEKETSSDTTGLWSPFADAASSMKPKPSKVIQEAEEALGRAMRSSLRSVASAPGSITVRMGSARDQLSVGYIQAMISVGGIPRSQGEMVLKKVLSPSSTACAGANCAKIFGIDDDLVSPFMNHVLVKTSLSETFSLPENATKKLAVMESLKPDSSLIGADSFVKGIAAFASKPPVELARNVQAPNPRDILSPQAIEKAAGKDFMKTVQSYTEVSFRILRQAENLTLRQAKAAGVSPEIYINTRLKAYAINDGLTKLPTVFQPVYRGISNVSRDVMQRWLDKFNKGEKIGLGFSDKPGLASASWRPQIAENFAYRSDFFGLDGGEYGVIFEIHNHRGVAIEKISSFANESEVLIPASATFKIESVGLLKGSGGVFHIRLRGE